MSHRSLRTDLALLSLVLPWALVSGLWLFYVKQPTFGSVHDYMGLMAWGVGIDQGKNLVQLISSWSAASPKTA